MTLDRRCAWPIAAVGRGRVTGILIRPAPEEMFAELRDRRVPRHLDELTRSPERVNALREHYGTRYYEPPYKLAVLGRLLSTVQWLHEQGYVVGDLQLRNAVFTIDPAPAVYLLDCDSCLPVGGRGALPEADPEQWKLPVKGRSPPNRTITSSPGPSYGASRRAPRRGRSTRPRSPGSCRRGIAA
ncbi:hypothetical protein ACFQ0B_11030 [Nonomuraea thailandensis]